MISHLYTFEVKSIPIHILGGLKSIPHPSRTSVHVHAIIMEVTPTCFDIYGFKTKLFINFI